ncbi:hypothetical protein J2755_001532 [Methanohalophilus levihalophilus]|nr:hypothetical protein [Methanohalophilus levihalophilus]
MSGHSPVQARTAALVQRLELPNYPKNVPQPYVPEKRQKRWEEQDIAENDAKGPPC